MCGAGGELWGDEWSSRASMSSHPANPRRQRGKKFDEIFL